MASAPIPWVARFFPCSVYALRKIERHSECAMTTLLALVAAFARAAETSSRLAKRDANAGVLRGAAPDEVEIAVAWLSGEARQGRIGVGWATLAALRGTPVEEPQLTLREIDAALGVVAATSGKGSAATRSATLRAKFACATSAEQDFLVRLLVGELRQGALEVVMLDAVAVASGVPVADVRRAATVTGRLGEVTRMAMAEGEGNGQAGLMSLAVSLHRPAQPMLATPADDIAVAMAKLGTAALEWKVDGARVQVYKAGGEVKVYTRALKDATASVPEIVEVLQELPAQELILDGEAVALAADGSPQPFQMTMCRFGRKLDIERLRAELPLAVRFFDCLHVAGSSLLDHPAQGRFDALAAALPASPVILRIVTARVAAAKYFYADALARGHEGVMAKALDAPYEAGWRRRQLAQSEARAHARPRRARRRVGLRPREWLALEPYGVGNFEPVVEIAFNDLQESPSIPVVWRCVSLGSRATGETRSQRMRTRSTRSRRCTVRRRREARRRGRLSTLVGQSHSSARVSGERGAPSRGSRSIVFA